MRDTCFGNYYSAPALQMYLAFQKENERELLRTSKSFGSTQDVGYLWGHGQLRLEEYVISSEMSTARG